MTPHWMRRRPSAHASRRPSTVLATALCWAMHDRDEERLRGLVAADAVLVVDGGAADVGGRWRGADAIGRELLAWPGMPCVVDVNGAPGLLMRSGSQADAVLALRARDDVIDTIWAIRNPEKLRHWNGDLSQPADPPGQSW